MPRRSASNIHNTEKMGKQRKQKQQQLPLQKEGQDHGKKTCTYEYTQKRRGARNEDFPTVENDNLLKFKNEITKKDIEEMSNLDPNIFDDRYEALSDVYSCRGTTLRTDALSKNEKGKQKQKKTNIDKKKQKKDQTKIKINSENENENGENEEQETEKETDNRVTATIKRYSQQTNSIPKVGKERCSEQESEYCINRLIDLNRSFLRHLENEEERATSAWNVPTEQRTQGGMNASVNEQTVHQKEHRFDEDPSIVENQNHLANEEHRYSCKINNQKYLQFQQNFERNFENVHRFLSSFDIDKRANDMSSDSNADIFLKTNAGGRKGFIVSENNPQQPESHTSPNTKSNNRRRGSRKGSVSSQNTSSRVYKRGGKKGANTKNNTGDVSSTVLCDEPYLDCSNTNSMIQNDSNHNTLGISERNIYPQQICQKRENTIMQNYNSVSQTETSSQSTNNDVEHFVNFSDPIEGLQVQRKTFADDPSLKFEEFIIPSYLLKDFNFDKKETFSEKRKEEVENKKQQETNTWSKSSEMNKQKTLLQPDFHRDDGLYRTHHPTVLEDNQFTLNKDIAFSPSPKSSFSAIPRRTSDNIGSVNKTGITTVIENVPNWGKSEFREPGSVTCTDFTSVTSMLKQNQYGLWNYLGSDTNSRTIRDHLPEIDAINKNNSRINNNNSNKYSDNKTKSIIEKLKSVSFSSKDGDEYITTHKNNRDLSAQWMNYRAMRTDGTISGTENQQVQMGGGHCCCCRCDCCKHTCNRHCDHYGNKQMEDYTFAPSPLYTNRNNDGIHFLQNQLYRRNEQKNDVHIMGDRFYGSANSSSVAPPSHTINQWLQFQGNSQIYADFKSTRATPNNSYSSNYASRSTGISTGSPYMDHWNTIDRNAKTRQTEIGISEPEKELKILEGLTEMIRRQLIHKVSTSMENRFSSLQLEPHRPCNMYKSVHDKYDVLGNGQTLHSTKGKKKNKPEILKLISIKKYYRYTRIFREFYLHTYKSHALTQLEQRLYNRYVKYKYWCWKKSKVEYVRVCNKLINKRESNATEEKKIRKKRYSKKLKDDGSNVKWRKTNFRFLDKILNSAKKKKTKKEKGNNNMGRTVQQQTQQSTQHITQQSVQQMTSQLVQPTTEHVSQHMAQHVAHPMTQLPTQVEQKLTHQTTQQTTHQPTNQTTHQIAQLPIQSATQQTTHQIAQLPLQSATQQTTRQIAQLPLQSATQQTTRQIAQLPLQSATQQTTRQIAQLPLQSATQQTTRQRAQLPIQSATQQMPEFSGAANLMHPFINEQDGFSPQKKCLNSDQRKNLAEIKRKGFFQRFILNDDTNLLKEFDTGVKQYIQNTHMKKKEMEELKPFQDPLKNVKNGNKKNTQNENTTNHLRDVNRQTGTNRILMNTNKKINNTSESNWKSQANGTGVKKYGSEKKKGKKQPSNWEGEEPANKTPDVIPSLEIDNAPRLKKFRQIVSKKECNKMIMNSILTIQWNVNNLSYLYLNKTGYVVSPEYNTHTDLNRFFILLLINNALKNNPSDFSVGIFFTYTGCCDIVFSVHCGIYNKLNVTYNLTMVPWFGFRNWGVLKNCVHDNSISITVRVHEIRVNTKFLTLSYIKTTADQSCETEIPNMEKEKKQPGEEKQGDEDGTAVTTDAVENCINAWRTSETNSFLNFLNVNVNWETEMEQNKRSVESDVGLGLGLDLDMGTHISDDDRETEAGGCEEDEEEPGEHEGHLEQAEHRQTKEGQAEQEEPKGEEKQQKQKLQADEKKDEEQKEKTKKEKQEQQRQQQKSSKEKQGEDNYHREKKNEKEKNNYHEKRENDNYEIKEENNNLSLIQNKKT